MVPQIPSYEAAAKAVQHLLAVQCLLPVQPSSIWDLCPMQGCCVVTSGAAACNPASSWEEQGGIFPFKMLSAPCRPCQQCGHAASPVLLLPGLGPWPSPCYLCTVGSAVQGSAVQLQPLPLYFIPCVGLSLCVSGFPWAGLAPVLRCYQQREGDRSKSQGMLAEPSAAWWK